MMQGSLQDAVIVAYGRSPVARAGKKGALRTAHPADYGAQVLTAVLKKVPQLDPAEIEDLVLGCAKPEHVQCGNLGRVLAQRAGLPDSVPGQTITRFCASGLQSIATAANAIMTGQAEVLVAGGVECMTAIPMGVPEEFRNAWVAANRPGVYMPMGITAENVAAQCGVTRNEMEIFAVGSHHKAAKAWTEGLFDKEIVPVDGVDLDGNPMLLTRDETVRPDCNLEALAKLKPCFKEDGLVTAATSSPTSDGAAFVVMMSAGKAKSLGITPIARFRAFAAAGLPGEIMGLGPTKAVPKVLRLTGLTMNDMDVIEINEAFAAQAIPCIRELDMDMTKVNPRGGAIALGHPLGATGSILACKALSYLQDTKGRFALITMCIGGGMGAAGILEML